MRDSKPSTYDLMQMHVQALYVHDERSRIMSTNDWQGGTGPRFFLGRTARGNVWRFRNDLPKKLCDELKSRCETETFTTSDRPRHEAEYVRILSAQAPIERIWFGPAYWFANGVKPAQEPIRINEQNAHLLQDGFQDWLPDVPYQQPFVAMIVDGQAVAVCASVRITAVAHEAGVETLASHRQKGYAVSVVSAWAGAVEKMGALPLYSTSFENSASQKVAARLGLSLYGVDFHVT
jgi:RimJ/RimL family protein N-acetyltransferase